MAAEFWLLAGPNGAGKTTAMTAPWLQHVVRHVRFLNADDRTLEKLRAEGWGSFANTPLEVLKRLFIEAAEEVHRELVESIAAGRAAGTESVLSTRKYDPLVEEIGIKGGVFGFIYIGLRSPELSAARVAQRVRAGGHDVPAEKLAARWQRSVANIGWFASRATWFAILDNSESQLGVPIRLIARGGSGAIEIFEPDTIPEITASLTAAFSS